MGNKPNISDDDLRELFTRMELSPEEIEAYLSNPYTRAYTKLLLVVVQEYIAKQLAEKLIERFLSDESGVMREIRESLVN